MCMSYAFHTPDKLSFILDLMNGERSQSRGTLWLIPGSRAVAGLSHRLKAPPAHTVPGAQRAVPG